MREGSGKDPHLFVILGGTGDLAHRKLLPALASLMAGHDADAVVLGVGRGTERDDDAYRGEVRQALEEHGDASDVESWKDDRIFYQGIGEGGEADYRALADRIDQIESDFGLPGNRVFYLALPPGAFPAAIKRLGSTGLNQAPGWVRLVVEKPFGRDLDSAKSLNELVHQHFDESQVYRIDHFLGKETVQNLLVFRFANPVFESLWNRDRVESVHITVAEDLGVGTRAGYYEHAGVLRDMVQNHLTQLLTLVGMEVPPVFEADAIRAEKVKVLRSMEPLTPDDVAVGQYGAGSIDSSDVPAYRDEEGVADDSETATFIALRTHIANWRWQGVPFYIRTGKRMARRVTQIVVTFRKAPVSVFQPFQDCNVASNTLVIQLQPDEGFTLSFEVKTPGDGIAVVTQELDFRYAEAFAPLPEAYVTLLQDIVKGDQTLFVHADEVEASWRTYQPILDADMEPASYRAGSWGPDEANRLLEGGDHWPDPET